ncbi:hypothetical protein LA6_001187 [Marinibacterium anthonyi]|nr:hypothetical protein LA6_001187 [Marinibacterium anthonyi]
MARPTVPPPKDVIAIAKGLKAEGITSGAIRCPDGTEIKWGGSQSGEAHMTELEKWKAKRNAP